MAWEGLKPPVKWAGGKRTLYKRLRPLMPELIPFYSEAFVGGGGILFQLAPEKALLNDAEPELIDLYETIRDDLPGLIGLLSRWVTDEKTFYRIRDIDRIPGAKESLTKTFRGARTLYLNKTCFNGLHRLNKKGEFNVPYCHSRKKVLDVEGLKALSDYLKSADISFSCGDFEPFIDKVPADCFLYLDPPYDPISKTSAFVSYTDGGFGKEDQERLSRCLLRFHQRGGSFLLSNSDTPFIRSLYEDWCEIIEVSARRSLAASSSSRGKVVELAIRGKRNG